MASRAQRYVEGIRQHAESDFIEYADVNRAWQDGYVAALRDMRKKVEKTSNTW